MTASPAEVIAATPAETLADTLVSLTHRIADVAAFGPLFEEEVEDLRAMRALVRTELIRRATR